MGREVPLSSLPSPGCLPASSQARVKVLRRPGSVGLFVLEDKAIFGCFLSSRGAALQEKRESV